MKHVFKAQKLGWEKEKEGVWFDADKYTVEEARAQFEPHHREVLKNNHWVDSTEYRFDGQTYHKVSYVGTFEDDNLPTCDEDLYR